MLVHRRLSEVLETAHVIDFDDTSKFIFFSDCHRGDNGWADDFADNQLLFFFALRHYFDEGFTYIELGDGDELWEHGDFTIIERAHSHIFWLLHEFYAAGRLHWLYGNHDIHWRNPKNVERDMARYFDEDLNRWEPLFPGITVHEGLILRHRETGGQLFLVYGHQGDLFADILWPVSCFLLRFFWRPLRLMGIRDPGSAAQNPKKGQKVERRLRSWVRATRQLTVFGHIHRPVLPLPGETLYVNTGSCVHPRCITGIEIAQGRISLIKWWLTPSNGGLLRITREVLAGPRPLREYWDAEGQVATPDEAASSSRD